MAGFNERSCKQVVEKISYGVPHFTEQAKILGCGHAKFLRAKHNHGERGSHSVASPQYYNYRSAKVSGHEKLILTSFGSRSLRLIAAEYSQTFLSLSCSANTGSRRDGQRSCLSLLNETLRTHRSFKSTCFSCTGEFDGNYLEESSNRSDTRYCAAPVSLAVLLSLNISKPSSGAGLLTTIAIPSP